MHCGIDHKETLAHTHFNTSLHSKDKLDQDSNYVKPLDWIKRTSGLPKRMDSDLLILNSDFWVLDHVLVQTL